MGVAINKLCERRAVAGLRQSDELRVGYGLLGCVRYRHRSVLSITALLA